MRFLRRPAAGLLALAALAPLAACGPNLRSVYDGEVEFERCLGYDRDEAAPSDERLACWSNWQQSYTGGQAPERIQHARNRVAALSGQPPQSAGGQAPQGGPPSQGSYGAGAGPSGFGPPQGGPQAQSQQGANGPVAINGGNDGNDGNDPNGDVPQNNAPQGAQTPPRPTPPTQNNTQPGPSHGGNANAAPPGANCSTTCRQSWTTCNTPCSSDAACVARCDDDYRDCMRGCY